MTRSATIFILWHGDSAICGGSKKECLSVAYKEGLLMSRHGEYDLVPEAAIVSYPVAEGFRWFSAGEVEAAKGVEV